MKPKVTVVDYGMGNILSVCRALEFCGAEGVLSDSPQVIANAERLILPGVGAFVDGMKALFDRGLVEPLRRYAGSDRPMLGICLGMQMLFDSSEEFGQTQGLGIIPGRVLKVAETGIDGRAHKIPHIGWNALRRPAILESWDGSILSGLDNEASVYFVHSFTAVPDSPEHRLADCLYDGRLISASVRRGSVSGCQFHPEKSGETGLTIIRNFLR